MSSIADNSFLFFVYPFLFESESFQDRVAAVESLPGTTRDGSSPLWTKQRFSEDDLLPQVARYLNPAADVLPTARLWHMENNALASPSFIGSSADWKMSTPHGLMPFRFEGFQLALFRAGIGFLTVTVKPLTTELSDWQRFLHYFRFVRRPRDVTLEAQRRTGFDDKSRTPIFESYKPAIVIEGFSDSTRKLVFRDIISSLLKQLDITGGEVEWWREAFVLGQLIPFAALFVGQMPEESLIQLLYKVRNFFHPLQGNNPSSDDLRADHNSLLPYAERQWFVFSLDGGAFVASAAPDSQFFRQTLPDHLRHQYFLLFLLVQHQRFVLMNLSEQVSRHWLNNDESVRTTAFERIRDALLDFTARGYFTQVMQREHHHRFYRKWQNMTDVSRLYQEVRDEVWEMHNYLQARRSERIKILAEEQKRALEKQHAREEMRERLALQRTRRLEDRISLLGLLIGIPMLINGFLGINLRGVTTTEGLSVWKALLIILGSTFVLVGVLVCVLRLVTRSRGEGDPKQDL